MKRLRPLRQAQTTPKSTVTPPGRFPAVLGYLQKCKFFWIFLLTSTYGSVSIADRSIYRAVSITYGSGSTVWKTGFRRT